MHKQRLYLDDYILEYLSSFGDLDTVINYCVKMAMEHPDYWTQTEINEKRGKQCIQLIVYIDNPEYEEYREQCGKHSQYCSIRRLLYYITLNEMLYDEDINWAPTINEKDKQLIELTTLWSNLVELTNKWKDDMQGQLLEACSTLQEVIDELNMRRAS